jgi:hypothetical protein
MNSNRSLLVAVGVIMMQIIAGASAQPALIEGQYNSDFTPPYRPRAGIYVSNADQIVYHGYELKQPRCTGQWFVTLQYRYPPGYNGAVENPVWSDCRGTIECNGNEYGCSGIAPQPKGFRQLNNDQILGYDSRRFSETFTRPGIMSSVIPKKRRTGKPLSDKQLRKGIAPIR